MKSAARTDRTHQPAPPQLSPGRRRLFLGLTIAFPWLLLLLLELGLRLGGYGSAYPLFVPHGARPEYLEVNPAVGRRYFRGPFTPTPEAGFFRAAKQPTGIRLAFQGESSAQGYPYGHGGAPSRMLEGRLQATFPGREVEVVNTALTAVNSYTLLDQADEIAAQRPDAVLIYTGHNEYYGALGVGAAPVLGRWRPAVKAYLLLRHSRAAQLLAGAVDAAGRALGNRVAADDAPRTVMELMAGRQRIPLGSPRYRRGLEQFRANLGELLERYRRRGIPVFVGTVASNEHDQAPLDGDDSAAVYFAAARRDETHGDTARARAAYRAAKEHDALRFRAPEAINAIIREEAARHGATVVETQQALERASPLGVVGGTVMLEHLHPNLDGYFLIADAFYQALRARGLFGDWGRAVPASAARSEIPTTPIDSLVGVFRTDRLTSGWPFRPRGAARTPVVDTLQPTTQEVRLAQAVVLGKLPWPEATERLRAADERAGDYAGAIRAARALAQEYRWAPEPWLDAAHAAVAAHRYDDAARYVQAAVARRETAPSAQLAGLLLLRAGDDSSAMRYLRRAAELAPADRRIAMSVRAASQLPALESARAAAPRDTAVLFDLAAAYALTQQYEKSRATLAALLAVAPRHARGRELLGRLPAEGSEK